MNRLIVIATDQTTAIVALEDEAGQAHLGRALAAVPKEGDVLRGDAPAVGLLPLRHAATEEPCPVALVLLNIEPAIAKLVVAVPHPDPAPAPD